MNIIQFAELGLLPDPLIRFGIRRLLRQRLRTISMTGREQDIDATAAFAEQIRRGPLAVATDTANAQHYEVPTEFFQAVLGPRLKYSCCLFGDDQMPLDQAEVEMLEQTCDRAEIVDGQRILELGCGWGSLTIFMAEKFPQSQITAVSNSSSQRTFIEARLNELGMNNVEVITADMRQFASGERFDRVVSVEMFEHMRNYELLLQRVSTWLKLDGKAFAHIFCHRDTPYLFETEGNSNWMGRHFFTGGMMPSEHLFQQFGADLQVEQQWRVNGLHYWHTSERWLQNLDLHRKELTKRFEEDLPPDEAKRNVQRWRMFFLACAELFRYRGGNEWFVGHYLFSHSKTKGKHPSNSAKERLANFFEQSAGKIKVEGA